MQKTKIGVEFENPISQLRGPVALLWFGFQIVGLAGMNWGTSAIEGVGYAMFLMSSGYGFFGFIGLKKQREIQP